jgi:hypothetical protein
LYLEEVGRSGTSKVSFYGENDLCKRSRHAYDPYG